MDKLVSHSDYYQNKVVVITGASSGIGRELAVRFSILGCKLVLAARNEKKLADVIQQIDDSENDVIAIRTDVSVEQDVAAIVNSTLEKFGKIDIFISNAAQHIQNPIHDMAIDEYRRSFDINLYGSLFAVKQAMPIMARQTSGHFVFINSLAAKKGIVGDAPYVAAKAALDGFADVLRQEVKQLGISVSSVFPGRVDTPMIQDLEVPWISPKIPVKNVADAVIKGIYKKKPIIVVPLMLYILGAINNLSPRLLDWFYKAFRLEGRKIK